MTVTATAGGGGGGKLVAVPPRSLNSSRVVLLSLCGSLLSLPRVRLTSSGYVCFFKFHFFAVPQGPYDLILAHFELFTAFDPPFVERDRFWRFRMDCRLAWRFRAERTGRDWARMMHIWVCWGGPVVLKQKGIT